MMVAEMQIVPCMPSAPLSLMGNVMRPAELFGLSYHLKWLLVNADPLEELGEIVYYEGFRLLLERAQAYSEGSEGRRADKGYDRDWFFAALAKRGNTNASASTTRSKKSLVGSKAGDMSQPDTTGRPRPHFR